MIPNYITHFKVQYFSMCALVSLFLPLLEGHLKPRTQNF
jgi:hypothetical protein